MDDRSLNRKVGPMRQGTNPKRLRSRTGRKNSHSRSQNFESNGPEVKVRGNAQQVVEKYLALARDATSAGDRITAESYFQHAEHYYRVMTANGTFEDRTAQNGRQQAEGDDRTEAAGAEAPTIEVVGNGDGAHAEFPEVSENGDNGAAAAPPKEDPVQDPQAQE